MCISSLTITFLNCLKSIISLKWTSMVISTEKYHKLSRKFIFVDSEVNHGVYIVKMMSSLDFKVEK